MSDLTGRTQNDTFRDLIHFENSNLGFDATLRAIESGNGIGSTLSLSTIGAAIAGTLSVAGVASFDLAPLVSGSPVWYPGNDGAGSGLDADLLDGLQATAFARAANPLTITGLWQFQTGPFFTALNDTELARFIDTTNDIQMQVKFDSSLDFSLVPGTSSVFDSTKRLRYDSSAERWAFDTGVDIFTSSVNLFRTQVLSATQSSGAEVVDGAGTLQDVGFNVMPNDNQAGVFTIGVTNSGHKERYTGAGSQAVTLTDEANIPDGATWVIVNAGTGALDITITTLSWYDGSGVLKTGNRILAIAGVATITKRIDGQYEIWGNGLT